MMKKFFSKNKKQIFTLLFTLAILITISVISLLILTATGTVTFDDGIKFNVHLFDSFRYSWYGWIVFMLIQSILSMFLCFIPGAAMSFILLSQVIYPNPWAAFALSIASVILSSTVMYTIGRLGGYKLCTLILGKEDCDKSLELLRSKSTIYFPLMMMFPIFPDDALVMIAGTIKMKLKWFIPSIVIGRGIGIATIIFGFNIIPFDSFTTLYDWIVCITVLIFWVYVIFLLAHKFNTKIEAKRQKDNAGDPE